MKTVIFVAVRTKIVGLRSQSSMIHGDANHFGITTIPGNRGTGIDMHWFAIVMIHVDMSKKGWWTRDRHIAST
ncbi:hypothetical protein TNCV_3327561 [Trichonephila clavipes]|nr:hypothetical protein TNCV_3327561 [Trichonephila clavipes]